MSKVFAFTAVITQLKRITNSVNGNPRYEVTFSNGRTLKTSSDHSFVYDIENLYNKADPLQVFVTRSNRICDLQKMGE